ncbi:F0F1 ATP synthase subunit alpha [Limibaculum sp. FT325]|uniref:F0F1 ATP synthase subunit alpha n=1 Tax=Thermohalobaculum sediminis TaxID=2939436 RepID=UPI0020BEF87F|nr:F0F1 ATP synthase subunit alpha [Limibaculum sediminis]MCL5776229.1 F0F1 ATP synthase subunit alpha [Limibaculum sediminis]
MNPLDTIPDALFSAFGRALEAPSRGPVVEEVGRVVHVGAGVAEVDGLNRLFADELVRFPGGLLGLAMDIDARRAGIALLGPAAELQVGVEARRTGRAADLPVGAAMLGRILDPLGRPLDDRPPPRTATRWRHERPAPPILDRAPVAEPLHTGIKAIDAAVPVGLGQRELIIGDRQTGKTAIALSAMLSHCTRGPHERRAVAVYCAVGQRAASTAAVIAALRREGAMARAVVIAAGGETAPGLQALAPFAAATVAEWFMRRGDDVLVVFDDLTRHARAWRELSLLLRRPPGREAYPGDVFYLHARLLERATRLRQELGGGSMTALPIVETQAQNISAYIPTNLISITDGQVYLSPDLFQKGHLPAIDIGRSVSRVGGKAQPPAFRAVAGDLRLMLAQFDELESFARFGARLDMATRRRLARGMRVRAALRQREDDRPDAAAQIAVLMAATEGLLDDVPEHAIAGADRAIRELIAQKASEARQRILDGEALRDEDRAALLAAAHEAVLPLQSQDGPRERADGDD